MGVVAVALIPTEVVFLGGQTGIAVSSQRTQALSLAAGALGKVRSVAYNAAGFSAAICGNAQNNYGGNTCVKATNPSALLSPSTTVTVGSTKYTINTYVVWVNSTGYTTVTTTYTKAYKQATALVSWSTGHSSGTVSESTLLYPGNVGAYSSGMSQ